MIVFYRLGALEFTSVPGRPGHLTVSAWREGSIEAAFPGVEVETIDPDIAEALWRRYRAIVRREVALEFVVRAITDVNYGRMYGEVMDARDRMMLEEWQSMWAEDSYQRWRRRTK